MSASAFPRLRVEVDGRPAVEVQTRQSDFVRLERYTRTGQDRFDGYQEKMLYLAYAAMVRLKHDVPADFDEFIDLVYVEPAEDAEGKASGQAAPTG
jgi:hypothetical protein